MPNAVDKSPVAVACTPTATAPPPVCVLIYWCPTPVLPSSTAIRSSPVKLLYNFATAVEFKPPVALVPATLFKSSPPIATEEFPLA